VFAGDQAAAEMARLEASENFADDQSDVTVFEDRCANGDWRVEWFDADGGGYVTIFAGEAAEQRARGLFRCSQKRNTEGHPRWSDQPLTVPLARALFALFS
jgi:hypothetical protein